MPSKITTDNKHINWHVLLSYKWRDESEYAIKYFYEPEEKFSFEEKKFSKARTGFLRLYERSLQILNDKKDAILYEEIFGGFTRMKLVENPHNVEVMKIQHVDFDLMTPEERKQKMPTGPWVFSVEFLTQKYDKFDPEIAPKMYIIFEKRFPCTNLFSQIHQTILHFHPLRKEDNTIPMMQYTEDDIAGMVYPWSRWKNTEATKYLDENWINSKKDLLLQYADTIVTYILESYGAKDDNDEDGDGTDGEHKNNDGATDSGADTSRSIANVTTTGS